MIELKLRVPDFAKTFQQHQTDILQNLAAVMQTNRGMMFDKDGADNGKPQWEPLKLRVGRPLQDKGVLRKSWSPISGDPKKPGTAKGTILRFEGQNVRIGTDLAYAGMMNDGTTKMPGGKLVPKKAQALKIPLEKGKFMFRRSVKIPARKMNEITPEDEKEFSAATLNYIADLLKRGTSAG